jgi:hypothetical protein
MVRRGLSSARGRAGSCLKLRKNPIWTLGKEPIELEGILHIDIDGTVMHGKIPSLQGNYYAFFDGVYNSIKILNR